MFPSSVANQVYSAGSLRNSDGGVRFDLLNRLTAIDQIALTRLVLDNQAASLEQVHLEITADGNAPRDQTAAAGPFSLPLQGTVTIQLCGQTLAPGKHEIQLGFQLPPFGNVELRVEDTIPEDTEPEFDADSGGSVREPPDPLSLLLASQGSFVAECALPVLNAGLALVALEHSLLRRAVDIAEAAVQPENSTVKRSPRRKGGPIS